MSNYKLNHEPRRPQPDAGPIIREVLMNALTIMVDRYVSDHYEGRPISPQHQAQLIEDPKGQVEDFIYFACRQPEVISIHEGVLYTLNMPEVAAFNVANGEELEGQ